MKKEIREYIHGLPGTIRPVIQLLRDWVMELPFEITEHTKWNAPSFIYKGDDRITLGTAPQHRQARVVLHLGTATTLALKERFIMFDSTLLEWRARDRAVMCFNSLGDLNKKKNEIQDILKAWLTKVDDYFDQV